MLQRNFNYVLQIQLTLFSTPVALHKKFMRISSIFDALSYKHYLFGYLYIIRIYIYILHTTLAFGIPLSLQHQTWITFLPLSSNTHTHTSKHHINIGANNNDSYNNNIADVLSCYLCRQSFVYTIVPYVRCSRAPPSSRTDATCILVGTDKCDRKRKYWTFCACKAFGANDEWPACLPS